MRRLLLLLACISSIPASAWATTYTAASCNNTTAQHDVEDAVNLAVVAGDVVRIPSGTCSWTKQLTVTKGISLDGAGEGVTIIKDNINDPSASAPGIAATVPSGEIFKLGNLTINPQQERGTGPTTGFMILNGAGSGNQIRLHHLTISGFGNNHWSIFIQADNLFGVADHITFSGNFVQFMQIGHSSFGGVGGFGDNSWAQPTAFGSANAMFVESSSFESTGLPVTIIDCTAHGGCRYVFRFNTLVNGFVGHHGTESPGRQRSGRQFEIYANSIEARGPTYNISEALQIRGGVGMIWGNLGFATMGASPGFNQFIRLSIRRTNSFFSDFGTCDGNGPYDDNDGMTYASGTHTGSNGATTLTDGSKSWTTNQWATDGNPHAVRNTTKGWSSEIDSNTATTATPIPSEAGETHIFDNGDSYQIKRAAHCIDQAGIGPGDLLSGNPASPTGWVHQAVEGTYIWMNNVTGASAFIIRWSRKLLTDRDYYDQASGIQTNSTTPFNGTTGVGWGTLANRPTTCTTGRAYFRTTSGTDWNNGSNALYTGDGVLDKCTSTNTWTTTYTPFTFPHPLATASPAITLINPSSGAQGAANFSISLSGSDTAWAYGTTVGSFSGTGITVNSTDCVSATFCTVNIDIAGNATAGPRTLTMTTNAEVETTNFTVNPPNAGVGSRSLGRSRGRTR